MSDGIPSRLSRTDAGTRRRDAMARLQNDVSGSETAYNKWTNKETVQPLVMELTECTPKPSRKRPISRRA